MKTCCDCKQPATLKEGRELYCAPCFKHRFIPKIAPMPTYRDRMAAQEKAA